MASDRYEVLTYRGREARPHVDVADNAALRDLLDHA